MEPLLLLQNLKKLDPKTKLGFALSLNSEWEGKIGYIYICTYLGGLAKGWHQVATEGDSRSLNPDIMKGRYW